MEIAFRHLVAESQSCRYKDFLHAWEIALPLGKVHEEAAMRAQGVSRVSRYFRVSEQEENAKGLFEKLEMSIRTN